MLGCSNEDEWGRVGGTQAREWNAFGGLVQIPVGKRQLGRSRYIWDGNIKVDLKEEEDLDCIHLVQDGD